MVAAHRKDRHDVGGMTVSHEIHEKGQTWDREVVWAM